jgi:hypothetical protein
MKISSTIRWGLGLAVIFAYEHLDRLSRTRYLPRLMILMGNAPCMRTAYPALPRTGADAP